jgi:hypothetical protein
MRPAACGHGLPTVLSGSAMSDSQSKAAAPPEVADWLAMQLDGDWPEQWLRSRLFPLLAVGRLLRSLRDQPVGGMKMCTLLIGSNQAVAAPPGAMILRTPFSTMVTP